MVEIHTLANPSSVLPEVPRAVASLGQDLPMMDVRTLAQVLQLGS
jgi:hypothetical protein